MRAEHEAWPRFCALVPFAPEPELTEMLSHIQVQSGLRGDLSPVPALAAGLAALVAAYAGNILIWRICRGRGTAWFVPVWEELAKTSLGLLAGQLLMVHAIFGLGEACLEIRRRDWAAGGLALFSHALFGLVTLSSRQIIGSWPAGLLLASGAHLAWNGLVLHFSRQRRKHA